jgi:hypothetical protein
MRRAFEPRTAGVLEMRLHGACLLVSCVLIAISLAPGQEGGVPLDPVGDAKSAVERFFRDFKPRMDTSAMNELVRAVRHSSYGLTISKDYRIVKPFVKLLNGTAPLSDESRQNILYTLGGLGDTTAAKVVMRYTTDSTMSPEVRYEAATALCLLGSAETGTQVLKKLAQTNALPLNHFPPLQFLGSGWAPVKLKSAADEEAITLYMRWLAERATYEYTIGSSVTYLLQKDEDSRDFALRVAERALQSPDVYLSGENDKLHLLKTLAVFGGDTGTALVARYEGQ